MHRFLKIVLTALIAGFVVVGQAGARDPDTEPAGRGPGHRRGDRAETMHVPPMFKELSPYRASRMEEMADAHSMEFRRVSQRIRRMVRDMEGLKLQDMEEFRRRADMMMIEDDIERLADEFRAAKSGPEQDRLEGKLKEKLEALFDARESAQRTRIALMQKELKQMKDKLDKRHRNRAKIIRRRLEELKTDADLRF